MTTRQTTRLAPHMLCPKKRKGVLQPIKIFLSETSWHKFQTCLSTKTLDSKVNTMCVLFFLKLLLPNLFAWCMFIFEFLLEKNTISNSYHSYFLFDIIYRIFLGVSYIHAQKQRNLKTKLKTDIPPYFHVCNETKF